MSKLDDVFRKIRYNSYYDEAKRNLSEDVQQFVETTSWAGEQHQAEIELLAKQEVKDLMLELIGEDEPFDQDNGVSRYKDGVDMWGKEYANNRNNVIGGRRMLRAELRRKVEAL